MNNIDITTLKNQLVDIAEFTLEITPAELETIKTTAMLNGALGCFGVLLGIAIFAVSIWAMCRAKKREEKQ